MTTHLSPQVGENLSDGPPLKRKRTDSELAMAPSKKQCLRDSLHIISESDAKAVDTIETKYDVLLHSVKSSSKIQSKVKLLLKHLTLPPAPGFITPVGSRPAVARVKIAVLSARCQDAGKLISIAEIAKREIEKERDRDSEVGGGHWFQYIALGEELKERPRDQPDKSSIIEESRLATERKRPQVGRDSDDRNAADEDGLKNGNQDGDDFEVMKTPFERAIEGRPLVRAIPVMSLFLSRSSVEELRKRYGEQTSSPSARNLE